jgi:hypothetical protein
MMNKLKAEKNKQQIVHSSRFDYWIQYRCSADKYSIGLTDKDVTPDYFVAKKKNTII